MVNTCQKNEELESETYDEALITGVLTVGAYYDFPGLLCGLGVCAVPH